MRYCSSSPPVVDGAGAVEEKGRPSARGTRGLARGRRAHLERIGGTSTPLYISSDSGCFVWLFFGEEKKRPIWGYL